MTPAAARNYRIARYIAGIGMVLAGVLVGWSVIANHNAAKENKHAISVNQQAIRVVKAERSVRIAQINAAFDTLCVIAKENRTLQRQSISAGPATVRARFVLAGVSRARLLLIVRQAEKRRDVLLKKYAAIECPRRFVQN